MDDLKYEPIFSFFLPIFYGEENTDKPWDIISINNLPKTH
jgi:hypothetical protein